MRWVITALLAACLAAPAAAEVGTSVVFLVIPPGARANGMGGAFAAVADDATTTYYNPAGLAFLDSRELSLTHSPWLPALVDDMYYEFVGYAQPFKAWAGGLGANLVFLSMGKSTRTDEYGNEQGEIYSYDLALTVSYGTKILDNLAAGLSLKWIREELDSQEGAVGNTYAVELGMLYNTPIRGLRVAGMLQNLGPKIAYIDESEASDIPRCLKVGIAYEVINKPPYKLLAAVDYEKIMVGLDRVWWKEGGGSSFGDELRERKLAGGLEFWFNDLVAFRWGYYHDTEAPNEPEGHTFGGSLKYRMLGFDFAYAAPPRDLGDEYTKHYSISVRF
jgi:hypothetical protein